MERQREPHRLHLRYDPAKPRAGRRRATRCEARRLLGDGNRLFGQWIDSCRATARRPGRPGSCSHNPEDLGLASDEGRAAKQAPFGAARLLRQRVCRRNHLRADSEQPLLLAHGRQHPLWKRAWAASTTASSTCVRSLRVVVVLRHTGCGAVSAAVDTLPEPLGLPGQDRHPHRALDVNRIFVPSQVGQYLESVWGRTRRKSPATGGAARDAVFVTPPERLQPPP